MAAWNEVYDAIKEQVLCSNQTATSTATNSHGWKDLCPQHHAYPLSSPALLPQSTRPFCILLKQQLKASSISHDNTLLPHPAQRRFGIHPQKAVASLLSTRMLAAVFLPMVQFKRQQVHARVTTHITCSLALGVISNEAWNAVDGAVQVWRLHCCPAATSSSTSNCKRGYLHCITTGIGHRQKPRTKHINCKYHHFRTHVASGAVLIKPVASEEQLADCLTKPNNKKDFRRHRKGVMGW